MKMRLYLILLMLISQTVFAVSTATAGMDDAIRTQAQKAYKDGSYKDAYELYRQLCLDADTDPAQVGSDLDKAVFCLGNLNRADEADAFRENTIGIHSKNWRLLLAAARNYGHFQHHGFIIAGEFKRGSHRGGGERVNSFERDRVRALQLMDQARLLAADDPDRREAADFFLYFADMMVRSQGRRNAWRLGYLTDLTCLPDYEPGYYYDAWQNRHAPADAEGNPVFHKLPKTWENAETDGQRWRWLLNAAVETDAGAAGKTLSRFANFLYEQFGVQTMASAYRASDDADSQAETGPFAVHTLGEDETIARLAAGIKRFKLPDEFNYIKMFKELNNHELLAKIFENRRQYEKAAYYWEKAGNKEKVKQITGSWGTFEPVMSQPQGKGAEINYRFRNGKKVSFEAYPVKMERLFKDIKRYIRYNAHGFEWKKMDPGSIGYRIIHENETGYLGRKEAEWTLALSPRPGHFDKRITVATPLQKPGAYLLKARMADGNESRIIIWVDDTIIVQKPLKDKMLYYVADAVSGAPVADAEIEFFGCRRKWKNKADNYTVEIENFAETANAQGQVILSEKGSNPLSQELTWLVIARTSSGRIAHLGFNNVWYPRFRDQRYNQVKTLVITDRPVYRPEQKVQFTAWIQRTRYDAPDQSEFAGKTFTVRIHNPQNEKIYEQILKSDAYGGLSGEVTLPEDAALGVYLIEIHSHGGGTFRVEEYKKPEFEVTVSAPDEPAALGEKVKASVIAKYYFGAPVVDAKVKYKIMRYPVTDRWFPPGPWDWLYGKGYAVAPYAYDWHPGWEKWGCLPRHPWWIPASPHAPELIAENEMQIGEDGTVEIIIDSAAAKAFHGDMDHRYEITAEVTDSSRRTIVGKGSVLAARHPFKVHVQADRGYYQTGETVQADFFTRTSDGKPVAGKGKTQLFRITYNDGKPQETALESWELNFGNEGSSRLKLRAGGAGQYRLACVFTDAKGRSREGAHIFTVRGKGFDSAGFRFNALELIPDRSTYAPGETAKLLINTDRPGSHVLLFLKPVDGIYDDPVMLSISGKSSVREIPVSRRDMPNFFVEAVTVSNGRVHTEIREIRVPPEKLILNLSVTPSEKRYAPGQPADIRIKLTDPSGEPFVGSTVLTVYDAAVEYISGGSNVPEIRAFFWKWRRSHTSIAWTSAEKRSHPLFKKKEKGMSAIGVFGHMVADEEKHRDLNSVQAFKIRSARSGMAQSTKQLQSFLSPQMPAMEMAKADAISSEEAAAPKGTEDSQVTVRKEFADTAFWAANITTDKNGEAVVKFDMPENLTGWKIRAWAMGHGTRVGQAEADVITAKDLMIRLQAPRFFVEKDEVVLSAVIHNYLKDKQKVKAILELDGPTLRPLDDARRTVTVEASGETRVDWRVAAASEGEAVVRMKAIADAESDAMEMRFPVYVHGMEKMVSFSGALRSEDRQGIIHFTVPKERRPETARLEVRWSPSLAGAMVDALPYLADYPYGCTEQTLNRFLPTVITRNTLAQLGIDLAALKKEQTNLNAQEIGDDKERAKGWKRYNRNPVFDPDEVDKMVKTGVKRLTAMQLSDGGWGWFSGRGEYASPHTTAVVIRGLLLAKKQGAAVVPSVLDDGITWLKNYQQEQIRRLQNGLEKPKKHPWKSHADNLDALIFSILTDAGNPNNEMKDFLYKDRTHLSLYGKALFGLALHRTDDVKERDMIVRNISQYLVTDDENQTAWLKMGNGSYWWYWYGSEIEAHAAFLRLLSRTEPKGETASRLVKYLLNNRKHAAWWNSTRDTALVIEAFADYLKASGEGKPDMTVEVLLDGKPQKSVRITPETLFSFDNKLVLTGDAVTSGKHTLELRKTGEGPLYHNAYLSYFSLEDFIPKAGLEIKVNRKFYKLAKADKTVKTAGSRGQALNQSVEKYNRLPLENQAVLKSGDLVEVELIIESKNDYEYVVFEDMKAAGFEPVDIQSGYTANGMGAYMELRDEKTAFFVRSLARGKHSLSYRLRAEIPGRFSALPTRAFAMYAPELKGNSDEMKVGIED